MEIRSAKKEKNNEYLGLLNRIRHLEVEEAELNTKIARVNVIKEKSSLNQEVKTQNQRFRKQIAKTVEDIEMSNKEIASKGKRENELKTRESVENLRKQKQKDAAEVRRQKQMLSDFHKENMEELKEMNSRAAELERTQNRRRKVLIYFLNLAITLLLLTASHLSIYCLAH